MDVDKLRGENMGLEGKKGHGEAGGKIFEMEARGGLEDARIFERRAAKATIKDESRE